MARRSRSRSPRVDPPLATPEFLRLMQQARRRSSDGNVENLGNTQEEILQYADAMVANYSTNAAHLLGTCRVLRGMLAQEMRKVPRPQDETAGVSNAAKRRRLEDCDHEYQAENPSYPRDNGEQYEVCRKCGAQR